ncbi:chemotaxis protein CheR [Nibricoccus aquaticus]|uniref:protein-glutamate O-methyltransferase n=1 Tax=Nibricoccus aquaticus TaxID=2576891 RepID=A0A290Q394_9BACT|nr:protein-glutamate O-methyltransferase CheR [Nibricoccus aquaticus]ATC62994.1 chemotaxis protein CheR [Nibricoccus aquaticus]
MISSPPIAVPLAPENFTYVCELLAREAAIVIEPGKEYLVETRLGTLASRRNFSCANALVAQLRTTPGFLTPLHREAIDALTTNETLFFRDGAPFDALRDHIIPQFRLNNPGRPFSLWSAASSTGQEAYSVAMLLAEHFPGLPTTLVGTDLCAAVVARARTGLYQQTEVSRGLPPSLLSKYFQPVKDGWQLVEDVRRRADFIELNLAKPWPILPRFHVVMLRNVMIYFDLETRRRILNQVKQVLEPGGYLCLGGAETTINLDPAFEPVPFGRATFYRVV